MQPLTADEIDKAVALIAGMPFDIDVIVSVRNLLRRHETTQRNWQKALQNQHPAAYSATADPDDTKEFMPIIEQDGD